MFNRQNRKYSNKSETKKQIFKPFIQRFINTDFAIRITEYVEIWHIGSS